MQDRKEQAKVEVATLVERFQQLTPAQVRAYNEENTKKGFIEPLFRALGWNIEDSEEVAAEENVSGKRVDYAFKLQGVPRFYLEAKPLDTDLTDPKWARQAVTYAYHKGVTWAVLCNFAGLRVFNANRGGTERGSGLVLNLSTFDYVKDFERLWGLSRQGIEAGLTEEEAKKTGQLPVRIPLEQRLYRQLRSWRGTLFTQIAQYGTKNLSLVQVDEIIQRLFNRLVFIRTCEDRELGEHELRSALNRYRDRTLQGRQPLLQELRRIFRRYAESYDSDLFFPHRVDVQHFDEPILAEIFEGLHSVPDGLADYDFSLIDADILGAVYEQYLGYVAQESKRRDQEIQRRMELGIPGEITYEITEKAQRRKEHGIYYTPQWVVDYIVRQTVGRFIEEHQKRPDAIHELKILDMACGSGSFLIRAYDELLKWQAQQAGIPLERLTQEYRTPVLLNNIYGVDLDPQAVEIARLNLLLRALAGRALLPSLEDNVRRGNSLISGTEAELRPYFGDGWEEKRPFNWDQEFPKIMADGGFDIIIGNPPWVMAGYYVTDALLDYLRGNFKSAEGKFDLYYLFIEQGCRLLSENGVFGMIVPNKFFHTRAASKLRNFLSESKWIRSIVDFGDEQIFTGATNYSCLLFLRKGPGANPKYIRAQAELNIVKEFDIPWSVFSSDTWHFEERGIRNVFEKVERVSEPLEHITARFGSGVQSGADRLLLVDSAIVKARRLESAVLRPFLRGRDVRRYVVSESPKSLIFPYVVERGEFVALAEVELQGYENVYNMLVENGEKLSKRVWFGKTAEELSGKWYGVMYLDSYSSFTAPHILTPCLSKHSNFALGTDSLFATGTAGVTSVVPKEGIAENVLYILGVLNSKLISVYAISHSPVFSGGYYKFSAPYLKKLPIRRIDFSDATDKASHGALVALVERMLALQERLKPLRDTGLTEEHDLLREVKQVDSDIDNLVYDLYGLTEAERRLVEGG